MVERARAGTEYTTVRPRSTTPLVWESLRERDWVARWVVFATLEGATLEGAAPDAIVAGCDRWSLTAVW